MEIERIRFYKTTSGGNGIGDTNIATRMIALRSNANGKFACAENAGKNPLIANRDAVSGWETFELISLDGNNVALKSCANEKYVCADNYGNSELVANRTSVDSWETFDLVQH
ncbi:unnamed protein product [Rotaria sp. Silwood2]|nr:unnamed protein product [Rotaria sp. Silwood2]CAF4076648.1 unnamed protein product [Rotaria sp. Silwood2]